MFYLLLFVHIVCADRKSGQPSAGYMPTRSPKRSCRSCGSSADASATTHPESGQARVPSGSAARCADASPPPVTPAWLQSLGTFAAQGTSAFTATHRRDCGRRSRPQTRSSPRTIGPPAAPVCSRPAPASAQMPGQAGHNGEAVTVGSRQTLHFSPWRSFRSRFSVCQPCGFNPSQPPKGGAITPGLRRRFESPPVPGSAS